MSGIYIHIPFCKSRCLYCDFYSTTQLNQREDYVTAVITEARQRITQPTDIQTVYFGGGTPSMLDCEQIQRILTAIHPTNATEITIEANPGDLTTDKLSQLHNIGINRLSIGVQSFLDKELQFIGRRHTAQQAKDVIHLAQNAGFDNISIDLMYALPDQTMANWLYNIDEALKLNVQHISCYNLTYETGTRLTSMVNEGKIIPANEDLENEMYDILCTKLKENGFIHYEVSNFALPGRESKHNSSYWNNTPYIGLGAGAHSYDGTKRRWNISNLFEYINNIANGKIFGDEEMLTEEQKAMEHIMLGLRTKEGIEATTTILQKARPLLESGLLEISNGNIHATQKGLHILNMIIEELV